MPNGKVSSDTIIQELESNKTMPNANHDLSDQENLDANSAKISTQNPDKYRNNADILAKKIQSNPEFYKDILEVFGQKRLDEIYAKIQNHNFAQNLEKNVDRLFEEMTKRVLLENRVQNVVRQMKEVERVAKNPAKIELRPFFNQNDLKFAKASYKNTYKSDLHSVAQNVGPHFKSWRGGDSEEREMIASNEMPIYHTESPNLNYQNNLLDYKDFLVDDVRLNEARIHAAIDGRSLTENEESKLNLIEKSKKLYDKHVRKNKEEYLMHSLNNVRSAFKGIVYDTDVKDTKYFKKQMRQYHKSLAGAMHKIGPNYLDGAVYLKYLEDLNSELKDSQDPEDVLLYNSINQFLVNKKQELKKLSELEVKRFENDLNKISKEFYEKASEFTKKGDDDFKWQAMMMMFAMGPFLPAIAGIGSLNVAAPILKPFLNFMMSNQGFATSFSNIIDCLGPFSWIPNQMHIPQAVEFLLNETPIVNSFFGNDGLAQLLLRNDLMQNTLDVLAPLQSSPLPFLMLSGMCIGNLSVSGMNSASEKSTNSNDNLKKFEEEIQKAVVNKKKILSESLNGKSQDESVAKKILDLKKTAFRYGKTMNLIAMLDEVGLKQLEDIKLNYRDSGDANETFLSIATKNGKLNREIVGEIFRENKIDFNGEVYKKIEARLLQIVKCSSKEYEAGCNQELISKEAVKNNLSPMASEKQLIEHQKSKLNNLLFVTPTPNGMNNDTPKSKNIYQFNVSNLAGASKSEEILAF